MVLWGKHFKIISPVHQNYIIKRRRRGKRRVEKWRRGKRPENISLSGAVLSTSHQCFSNMPTNHPTGHRSKCKPQIQEVPGWELRFCISHHPPENPCAADQHTTLWGARFHKDEITRFLIDGRENQGEVKGLAEGQTADERESQDSSPHAQFSEPGLS